VQKIIGDKDPKNAVKNTMRSFYANDRFDNAFFISESFAESLIERDILFHDETSNGHPGLKIVSKDQKKASETMSPIDQIMMANANELAIVLIAPSLVKSGDFIYILDDIYRQKYTIAGVRKAHLEKDDLTVLFKDLAPRMFNIDVMWDHEFGDQEAGDSLVLVLEKEKAISDIQALVGRS